MAFPPLGNSDHAVISISIDFPSNSEWDAPFLRMAYEYSRADWAVIVIISEMFHGRICLNSVLLLLLLNFASGFMLKLMHISFLVSIRASLTHLHGFHLLLLLAIVHKNHFLCLNQQNKSSESKVKLKQTSNHCKSVPEAAKLAYANKTRVNHFPETWLLGILVNW